MIETMNCEPLVNALHGRIKHTINLLFSELRNRHPDHKPSDREIYLCKDFYEVEAKYAAGIIPDLCACRDLPKLEVAASFLEQRLHDIEEGKRNV